MMYGMDERKLAQALENSKDDSEAWGEPEPQPSASIPSSKGPAVEIGNMEIDAVLCSYAEAVNNQLYLCGGGIDTAMVTPGAPAPYGVNLACGIIITIPWTATNAQHTLLIELLHEDGQPVEVPTGPNTSAPFRVQLTVNVGRPPHLNAGDDQHVSMAANLPGMPLPAIGKYIFRISVDGTPIKSLPFRLLLQPGGQLMAGPAAPGALGLR